MRISLVCDGIYSQVRARSADKYNMATVGDVMTRDVFTIDMDVTLGAAIEFCTENGIRHLPVVDENKCLTGMVTDRDLRSSVSPRLGTISENNADRETLGRRVHLIMARRVFSTTTEATLAEAAKLMLEHHVGCLPVIDGESRVIGLITTSDLLRSIAQNI